MRSRREFGVDVTLAAGEKGSIEFLVEQSGSFVIFCKLHPRNIHLPGTLNVVS